MHDTVLLGIVNGVRGDRRSFGVHHFLSCQVSWDGEKQRLRFAGRDGEEDHDFRGGFRSRKIKEDLLVRIGSQV
jgi:hypothetical protein